MNYKELFSTFKAADIIFAKSVLAARNIRYAIQGEYIRVIRPFDDPAVIMVDEEQFDEAQKLLADFKERFPDLI